MTPQEGNCPPAKESGFKRNQIAWLLGFGLLGSRILKTQRQVPIPQAGATEKQNSEMSDNLQELLPISERAAVIERERNKQEVHCWFQNPEWYTSIESYEREYRE